MLTSCLAASIEQGYACSRVRIDCMDGMLCMACVPRRAMVWAAHDRLDIAILTSTQHETH